MDRVSRYINNQKQDKVRTVKAQPSISALREGEEVLYHGTNKPLRRYRKQNGILWYSDMTRDGNEYVDNNLTVKNNATISGDINANGNIVGDDSTDITNINQIQCDEILHDGDTDTKITFTSDQIDFYAGNIKMLTIDEAGADVAVFNEDGVDVNFRIESLNDVNMFKVDGGTDVVLIGRGSKAATSISPNPALEVDGYVSFDGFLSRAGTGGSDDDDNVFNFYWDGSEADIWIDTTEIATGHTTSDHRIKENVTTFSDSVLNKINALRPISYTQKECGIFEQNDKQRIGFIAHEVQEQFPNIVKGDKDAVDNDGNPVIQSINDHGLTAYLIKAVQELSAEVEKLKG